MSSVVPPATRAKRAFWFAVAGVVLNTLALIAWATGGPLASDAPGRTPILILGVFLQFAAVSALLTATIVGIAGLVRRTRPLVWPLLAALAVPIAALIWLPMVFVVYLIVG